MTDLRTPDSATHASRLEQLLLAHDRDPRTLADELADARWAQIDDPALRLVVARAELRFLRAQAPAGAPSGLREAVQSAEVSELHVAERCATELPPGDVEALFDLVELRAQQRLLGDDEAAARIGAEIERRANAVAIDDRLREEARERYVALAAAEEELELRERSLLLEELTALLRRLAERSGDRELVRMQRRLWRQSCDAVLALRLERLLGTRGASVLENLSFGLLVVLLLLLAAEALAPLTPATAHAFLVADSAICAFFIVEFALKLSLAPAKRSWFLRNVVTDLLPALPAAALFLQVPDVALADETAWVRALRLLRIAYFARYVQALRPVLRLMRLVLFMVRGMDELVGRFSPLLNRNFVFFERQVGHAAEPATAAATADPAELTLRALRREHVLISELPDAERIAVVQQRADRLRRVLAEDGAEVAAPAALVPGAAAAAPATREVPIERVVEALRRLRPDDLTLWMPRRDLLALDRVARVLNAPLVRSLPFLRLLRTLPPGETPEQRVVDLGQRVADRLERWRERILFVADLHGVLTGPQILDRIASAMIQASKRPAVRMLLFGGLFVLVQLVVGRQSGIGHFLEKFVATPLLVLGGVCLVLLVVGRWLKRIAGEAAETLKRTAEAHFIGLLELVKNRQEDEDERFLVERVFRWEVPAEEARAMLARTLHELRTGHVVPGPAPPPQLRQDVNRLALLYLHYLDGAILHENDAKTTEQLLANLSLENVRNEYLHFTRHDRKRLKRLSLMEGQGLGGPYLWFHCITESVALETAKRVVEYNHHCVPVARWELVGPEAVQRMRAWMAERRGELTGRTLERQKPVGADVVYGTTEFSALDFLSVDPAREEHVRLTFGDELLVLLRADRRRLVREVFGTTPLDRLPRTSRTVNFYAIYRRWLSGGRVLLLPLLWLGLVSRALTLGVRKTWRIVQEITAPDRALRDRPSGEAPFAVAVRKIHRMKAPGLLEAMRMRAAFDPSYCGAPSTWSEGVPLDAEPEIERDMDFLGLREHERAPLRALAARMRQCIEGGHARLRRLPPLGDGDALQQRFGERAVTIAYATDRWGIRSLLQAEDWFERRLRDYEAVGRHVPRSSARTCWAWLRRGCKRHPVVRWLNGPLAHRKVSGRARRNFVAAWQAGDDEVRAIVGAWLALPPGTKPRERAFALARRAFFDHAECSRGLTALRAVQSLSVLDVQNYRRLVFRLGGFADDGEAEGEEVGAEEPGRIGLKN